MAQPRERKTAKKRALRRPQKIMNATNWPKNLCLWTDEQMTWAIDAVKSGELEIKRSALEYGVPKTTLKDRIAGRVKHVSPGQWLILIPVKKRS